MEGIIVGNLGTAAIIDIAGLANEVLFLGDHYRYWDLQHWVNQQKLMGL
ncbi:hypothetical protein DDB_G0273269 [Dictyostelium discoideum AX4]|uniref:Uncharacterized protein n=1 Tax=Dictyostelium discoideum TaxID=44689 RepID=Q556R0_DICDI|nr:hypothetical protein DDB_G0273889 [Dictyostelium discoideum AX4]XP_644690.1 hypothetical protein DDB_G0273269 [Dictyostelium discoideum AX4]EAL70635.1 hypothetical protein DDB_G0273889 [Dictyostelium discoideum AX4]EAL70852.1 hypothetical protein DDB_G0273269 [Dictyostelium discoideum AX4]|eukprot:XP_644561.1 hypothetical protein DDB_G0273889 [Dictyostelium discoideum AX4]